MSDIEHFTSVRQFMDENMANLFCGFRISSGQLPPEKIHIFPDMNLKLPL